MTDFDTDSSLLQYGINYDCKNLMTQGPAWVEYTMATLRVGSHSYPQITPRVEVTQSDKHSSLLQRGISYRHKKLYDTGVSTVWINDEICIILNKCFKIPGIGQNLASLSVFYRIKQKLQFLWIYTKFNEISW